MALITGGDSGIGRAVAIAFAYLKKTDDARDSVNGVAPGLVWTPLIPSTFSPEEVAEFGSDVPLARAGEPAEIASAYGFLASAESSFMTGQVMHPNGGEIING